MTPEQLRNAATVMLAAAEGAEIEFKAYDMDSWALCTSPIWEWNANEYRVRSKPREYWIVNGVAFDTEADAFCYACQRYPSQKTIHVREVLE